MEQPNDLKKILSTDNINELDDSPKKQYNSLDSMADLLNMVDNERSNIENKPWSKIDKVNKNTILKKFINDYIIENELSDDSAKQFKSLLIKSFNNNLLNKQSDVKYNIKAQKIEKIIILSLNEDTNKYEIIMKDNKVKVAPKTKSMTNIDRVLNRSKKNR